MARTRNAFHNTYGLGDANNFDVRLDFIQARISRYSPANSAVRSVSYPLTPGKAIWMGI